MHHLHFAIRRSVLRLLLFMLIIGCSVQLRSQRILALYSDSLDRNIEQWISNWHFSPAPLNQPVTDTRGWQLLPTSDFGKKNAPPGWNGIGWFGLWLKVDKKGVDKKLGLRINHDGASEIFIDGKPIGGFGKVGSSAPTTEGLRYPRELVPFWLADTLPHLLTIRYANFDNIHSDFSGFDAYIGDYPSVHTMLSRNMSLRSVMPMCAAAQWMLALMHLLLFVFYPRQQLNLYFAAYAAVMGMIVMASYLYYETHQPAVQYYAEYAGNHCMPLLMWFGGLLLYNVGYGNISAWKKTALAVSSLFCFIFFLMLALSNSHFWEWRREDHFDFVSLLFLVFLIFFFDQLRGIFLAIRKGKPGLWLIGIGVLSAIIAISCSWLDIFNLWSSRQNGLRLFTMSVGTMVFPVCMSLYLALDFARTNKSLVARLAEVKKLSGEALKQEAEKRTLIENEALRLERTVQKRTAELQRQTDELQEMDKIKSRFFTNITHEFKTPLTLISNPAQELLALNNDASVRYYAGLIQKNSERLLQLINQLLDLSKLESGLMPLTPSSIELVSELKKYTHNHLPLAMQKGIELIFTSDCDELWIQSDPDKLEKICSNLLSNALKFTDKGRVEMILKTSATSFTLSVEDTGQGIASARIPYIFERFYQADPSDIRSAEGSGIGLALTRELVTLMGGSIGAESVEGQYTSIKLTLPMHPAFLQQQMDNVPLPNQMETAISLVEDINSPVANDDSDLVLVIEDNDALRDFVCHILSGHFRVMSAEDGKSGTETALQNIPDIVITDIMMPGMNGYEVCSLLKSDERTSHIPVIMLTAKTGVESRIQGIETGADAYLEKPFNRHELHATIEKLINLRSVLQKKYSNAVPFTAQEDLPSIEQEFITRIHRCVAEHLDDPLFGGEQLASLMNLSRSQLHRKLKSLLNKSPGDLIRTIRLEHAHYLLRKKTATVAEVAYRVGFGSPASFSTSFSRHFGFPPGDVFFGKILD